MVLSETKACTLAPNVCQIYSLFFQSHLSTGNIFLLEHKKGYYKFIHSIKKHFILNTFVLFLVYHLNLLLFKLTFSDIVMLLRV